MLRGHCCHWLGQHEWNGNMCTDGLLGVSTRWIQCKVCWGLSWDTLVLSGTKRLCKSGKVDCACKCEKGHLTCPFNSNEFCQRRTEFIARIIAQSSYCAKCTPTIDLSPTVNSTKHAHPVLAPQTVLICPKPSQRPLLSSQALVFNTRGGAFITMQNIMPATNTTLDLLIRDVWQRLVQRARCFFVRTSF